MLSTLFLLLGPFLLGYLMGSIPFGLLLTRAAGLGDIRKVGSGNIGATNVLRTGHKGLAAATLLLDALKGAVVGADRSPNWADSPAVGAAAGRGAGPHVSAVALLQGRQGRGDDAGRDVGPVLAGRRLGCAPWLVFAALFRYSSLATLLTTLVGAIASWFPARSAPAILLILVPLVWARHHANIRRLLKGTEPKIGQRSSRGRLYFSRVKPSALQSSLPTPWWTKNRPSGSYLVLHLPQPRDSSAPQKALCQSASK